MAIFSVSNKQGAIPEIPRRGDSPGLTIVAAGTRIVGDVEAEGVIKIEGEVRGMVRAVNQVLIAKGGVIHGDIVTRQAIIGGETHGTIKADERVEVQPGAVVDGDIHTQRILISDGGTVNGQISMEQLAPISDSEKPAHRKFIDRGPVEEPVPASA